MTEVGRVGASAGLQHRPMQESEHIVRRGETLWGIARQHGVSLRALENANPRLASSSFIFPGDRVVLPGREAPARWDGPEPIGTGATPATQSGSPALRAMFDPARGSSALGAIVIGQAEGTRTPSGGFRAGYYGHTDPGNGVANLGSFSLQNARGLTPEQADAHQLTRLSRQIPAFETAARGAGLDPDNAALSTAYLDLYNQSPSAAGRFIDQLDYLSANGVTTETLVELRVRSFVNHETGERFRLSSGSLAGGGFANIARGALGREPSGREVQAVIRRDQNRRVTAMAGALPTAGTTTPPVGGETPAQGEPARFPSNRGLDITAGTVARTNALYDSVLAETGHALHVTSGRRGPERQAAAMYDNFADNSSPTYRNRAAFNEVRAAYISGREAGLGRAAIVDRMADVLQAQVDRGVFISRHMSDRAIDIRMPPAGSRAAVVAAIRDNPAVQSVGVEDDHLHIQFR